MSDLGYWMVMFGLAIAVILATGGVTAYAYFSEDRWGKPREILDEVRDKVTDDKTDTDERSDRQRERQDIAA